MPKRFFLALLLFVGGCASSPADRALQQERLQRCALVEVYPMGLVPQRPYRIVGNLRVTFSSPATRDKLLRDQACSMGAQAVMDVTEEQPQEVGFGTGRAEAVATGVAIAFVDPTPTTSPN